MGGGPWVTLVMELDSPLTKYSGMCDHMFSRVSASMGRGVFLMHDCVFMWSSIALLVQTHAEPA